MSKRKSHPLLWIFGILGTFVVIALMWVAINRASGIIDEKMDNSLSDMNIQDDNTKTYIIISIAILAMVIVGIAIGVNVKKLF